MWEKKNRTRKRTFLVIAENHSKEGFANPGSHWLKIKAGSRNFIFLRI
jgi:hypothetical protein